MPAFSVIVPVYNVASYLRECLDSIRAQTFGDWECLCVDDGSTDGSGTILDEHAARDARFRVFHQANAGVSAARNAALSRMAGDAFLFVDGDDSIAPDALASFVDAFRETGADALLCHPVERGPGLAGGRPVPGPPMRILGTESRPVRLLVGPFGTLGYPFSRVYRTAAFGHLRFAEGIAMCEDNRYWADALCVPARWAVLDKPYYAYRANRPGAETSNPSFRHRREHLEGYAYVLSSMAGPMGATGAELAEFCRRYRNEIAHVLFETFGTWRALRPEERRALLDVVSELRSASPDNPLPFASRLLVPGCRIGLAPLAVPGAKTLWRLERSLRHRLRR